MQEGENQVINKSPANNNIPLTSHKNCGKFLFLGMMAVKLILMGLFSSDYQNRMFEPFVAVFLDGRNPYEYYYQNDLIASFPYFPLMLLINSVGGILIRSFSITNLFLKNLVFKMPLMFFDCLAYFFIRKLGVRFKYAFVFCFCVPIILYGTYMHGQLDIIPTAFLIIAIYFLLEWKQKNHLTLYALFLGLALSTKLHILAAVPVLFLYLIKKRDGWIALKYHFIAVVVAAGITAPFWGQGFIHTVLFNKEQSLLMTTKFDYGSTQILIPVLILLVMYFSVFELNYFNKNLLLSMTGLLFAVFLICLPPMPAWFTWIVPFVALYFGYVEEDRHRIMVLYAFFNLVYLIYFIFFHRMEYVDLYFLDRSMQIYKASNHSVKYVIFTVMSACLGIIMFKMYQFGLATNSLYQRRGRAFTIGIAGDSGAGKTRMLEKIEHLFGSGKDILFIEGDGDHRWARGDDNWERYTALDPQANYLYRQAEDIRKLKDGIYVDRAEYDHDKGILTEKRRVTPKKFIVLSGLHSLYLPKLRKVLDLKIYMDTDEELRKFWKIQRDVAERGYSKEKIIRQIEERYSDAEKYIYPQRSFADVIVTYFDKTLTDCLDEGHMVSLSVKFEVTIDLDMEPVIRNIQMHGINPEWKISDDLLRQEIIFDGKDLEAAKLDYGKLAEDNISQYEDFFTYKPTWGEDVEGIIQLMLLFIINERMRG